MVKKKKKVTVTKAKQIWEVKETPVEETKKIKEVKGGKTHKGYKK